MDPLAGLAARRRRRGRRQQQAGPQPGGGTSHVAPLISPPLVRHVWRRGRGPAEVPPQAFPAGAEMLRAIIIAATAAAPPIVAAAAAGQLLLPYNRSAGVLSRPPGVPSAEAPPPPGLTAVLVPAARLLRPHAPINVSYNHRGMLIDGDPTLCVPAQPSCQHAAQLLSACHDWRYLPAPASSGP